MRAAPVDIIPHDKDILRDEFGFEGHVVSDCWAILDFHEHHHVTDTVEAVSYTHLQRMG